VRALAFALALVLAVAAPASAAGFFSREPEAAQVVDAITFTGLHDLSARDLGEQLFTKARPRWQLWRPRPEFDPATLDTDMQRVVDACRERGHFLARASYTLEWLEDGHAVRIRIQVEEGPAVHLTWWGVDLSELPGGDAAWHDRLLDGFPLRNGAVFTVADYGEAKRRLQDGLADAGFPDATLSGGGEVDVAQRSAVVWWRVHPGALVRFGEIRVEGVDRVSEALVRRELTFAPGETWSREKLRQSQDRIADLGLFRSVVLLPLSESGDRDVDADQRRSARSTPDTTMTRPIEVQLEERPPRSVRVGVGVGTQDKVRLQAGWLHRNVTGRGDSLDFSADVSFLTRTASATLREPRLPFENTNLLLSSRLSDDTVPAYDARSWLSRIGVEWPLRPGLSGYAGYAFEYVNVLDTTGAAARNLDDPEQSYTLGHLDLGLRLVSTDDLFEPTRGSWVELDVEPGFRALGGDRDYLKATLDLRGYQPLGPVVVAGRVVLGSIDGYGGSGDEELPVTKLFYGGGSTNVRGYGFQRLGPIGEEGKALGGASELMATLEARFPLWPKLPNLGGVAFVDAGQLSLDAWDFRPAKLRYAPGFGFRYATPIGPVRLDFAFPLDAPRGVQPYRIWVSVGQAF